jgi:galactose mutarotase-like enzyme
MSDAHFQTYVLRDAEHDAEVHVVPARGGMVTRFRLGSDEVLYLDPATLADPSKKVRGGIPILFPTAGRLTDDRYRARGREWSLNQHGFARELAWQVEQSPGPNPPRIVLGLTSDNATLAMFPWRFRLTVAYALSGATLSIDFACENDDSEALPLHVGFHPYFHVPDALKAKTTIDSDATTARDNTTGEIIPFSGFDLTRPTLDLQLLDHTEHGTQLCFGQRRVRLDSDVEFSTLVVWTVGGKDYVCVEPWSAPSDALNTEKGVIHVPAKTTHSLRWSITADL